MYVTITCMHFKVNVRMKKPTLCCCFIWIIFIELNFTVALLLIRKTWMTFCWLVVGIGGGGGDSYPFADYVAVAVQFYRE